MLRIIIMVLLFINLCHSTDILSSERENIKQLFHIRNFDTAYIEVKEVYNLRKNYTIIITLQQLSKLIEFDTTNFDTIRDSVRIDNMYNRLDLKIKINIVYMFNKGNR